MGEAKLNVVARFIEHAPGYALPGDEVGRIWAAVAALMDDEREWTPLAYPAIAQLAQRNLTRVTIHIINLCERGYLAREWRPLYPNSLSNGTHRYFYRLPTLISETGGAHE